MSRVRLIALDIDGTILRDDDTISERVRRAIREAQARGVAIALATSRRWTGASPIARELGLAGSLVLYDGALIRGYPDGAVQHTVAFDRGLARRAATIMAQHELQVVAQRSDANGEWMLASKLPPHPEWMKHYLEQFPAQVQMLPLDQLAEADVLRMVSFGPLARLRQAHDALGELPIGRQVLPWGSYDISELTAFAPDASKGAGVVWLARRLSLDMAETMAIGDSVNDISMLAAAGMGVAMGDATPDVLKVADAVTETCAQDGAAVAIERYALDGDSLEPPKAEASA